VYQNVFYVYNSGETGPPIYGSACSMPYGIGT